MSPHDDIDARAMNVFAERLDALFNEAEHSPDRSRCPLHPDQIVYLDGGCQRCAWLKSEALRKRRVARRQKRAGRIK